MMELLKEIASFVGIALTNLQVFKGEDRQAERGP
jgi:GAF domain-containing protein